MLAVCGESSILDYACTGDAECANDQYSSARLGVNRAWVEEGPIDACYRHNFRIITGREYPRGCLEILVGQNLLDHGYSGIAQQPDDSLAGNAGQKRAVSNGDTKMPTLAIKIFEVASSATLPNTSQTTALSNPRACA